MPKRVKARYREKGVIRTGWVDPKKFWAGDIEPLEFIGPSRPRRPPIKDPLDPHGWPR